ncbi:hypothetical protein EVAR_40383_1 [Eumeta japonica]|uniref:Uncharacterized protein n=1 Tax=Eumeta variegata TaxID=151549 RepID=A0A4C1XKV7_EUMVA|nr:hypothetical protein EVAR_40383_1 [Eumeta japonica]
MNDLTSLADEQKNCHTERVAPQGGPTPQMASSSSTPCRYFLYVVKHFPREREILRSAHKRRAAPIKPRVRRGALSKGERVRGPPWILPYGDLATHRDVNRVS